MIKIIVIVIERESKVKRKVKRESCKINLL